MGFIENAERVTQDTANVATSSGVSGSTLFGFITQQLPGPSIARGFNNLRSASDILGTEAFPPPLEEYYRSEWHKFFSIGQSLKSEHKKSGRLAALKLYRRASEFENDTYALRGDVQTSSDYFAFKKKCRRNTPSMHTVESAWEITSRPSSPAPPPSPSMQMAEPFSGPPAPATPSSSATPAEAHATEHVAAGRLLATLEEEPADGRTTEQEQIPLGVVVTTDPLGAGGAQRIQTVDDRAQSTSP